MHLVNHIHVECMFLYNIKWQQQPKTKTKQKQNKKKKQFNHPYK